MSYALYTTLGVRSSTQLIAHPVLQVIRVLRYTLYIIFHTLYPILCAQLYGRNNLNSVPPYATHAQRSITPRRIINNRTGCIHMHCTLFSCVLQATTMYVCCTSCILHMITDTLCTQNYIRYDVCSITNTPYTAVWKLLSLCYTI